MDFYCDSPIRLLCPAVIRRLQPAGQASRAGLCPAQHPDRVEAGLAVGSIAERWFFAAKTDPVSALNPDPDSRAVSRRLRLGRHPVELA